MVQARKGYLTDLIGRIYDCVLDRERWPSVMRDIGAAIGGSASQLYVADRASGRQCYLASWQEPRERNRERKDRLTACGADWLAGMLRRYAERRGERLASEPGDAALLRASAEREAARDGVLRAPMPGTVVSVPAEPGMAVREGDVLAVMVAMKIEIALAAPFDGVVERVACKPGDLVGSRQALVTVGMRDEG